MLIKQASTISVDIGHSNLKIIQTASDGRINKFVVHKMPEGCVDDLNISSEEALVRSLKTARRTANLSPGHCHLVLSGSDILIRHFTLPMLDEEQLYQNILHEISGYLPVDPEKYYVDYKISGIIQEDGIDMYRLTVTTAHKRLIDKYKKALNSAGLRVKVVDTCENSKEKLLRYNHEINNAFPISGGTCIIDFGTKYTRVHMYLNGYYYVSNILKRSSQSITEVISKYSGKDILVSETIKRETDFLSGDHSNTELKSSVTYEVDSMLYEINRVFDYYKNRTKNAIKIIYISGGGSLLPGLQPYMEKHIGVPVRFASDLIAFSKVNSNFNNRGFSFLLNAYAATFREEK